ncbi:unnamed protein product [Acanthosepion pharaonis]|uniref:Uncharacterized protein n=1 Tax=Acanthosepion pharaonis TaxID=158019 RepID=A0A812DLI3_ACAPH|nr:unnamed protein product [Sepia pharaonis]
MFVRDRAGARIEHPLPVGGRAALHRFDPITPSNWRCDSKLMKAAEARACAASAPQRARQKPASSYWLWSTRLTAEPSLSRPSAAHVIAARRTRAFGRVPAQRAQPIAPFALFAELAGRLAELGGGGARRASRPRTRRRHGWAASARSRPGRPHRRRCPGSSRRAWHRCRSRRRSRRKALTPALLNPNSVFALRLTSTAISLGWLATIAPL